MQDIPQSGQSKRVLEDQFFLYLYNLTFINLVEQWIQLIPDGVRTINPTCVKVNLPWNVVRDYPNNLILLSIDDSINVHQICNRDLRVFPPSLTFLQILHISFPYCIIMSIENNRFYLVIHPSNQINMIKFQEEESVDKSSSPIRSNQDPIQCNSQTRI